MSSEHSTKTTEPASEIVFSTETMADYREILTHYPQRRAALMPVLWLAQREFGWISPDVIAYVAALMELPVGWVEGAVTFYTMYYTRPKGRHHIQLCTNVSCQLRGADEVMSALRRHLAIDPGETTRDGEFSLDRAECLGSCGTAPVIQLGSGPFVESLTVDKVMELVERLRKGEAVDDLTSTPKEDGADD
jgi:NADH-quinone oxidoreductase subunit E